MREKIKNYGWRKKVKRGGSKMAGRKKELVARGAYKAVTIEKQGWEFAHSLISLKSNEQL